jgi:hypothetical protein
VLISYQKCHGTLPLNASINAPDSVPFRGFRTAPLHTYHTYDIRRTHRTKEHLRFGEPALLQECMGPRKTSTQSLSIIRTRGLEEKPESIVEQGPRPSAKTTILHHGTGVQNVQHKQASRTYVRTERQHGRLTVGGPATCLTQIRTNTNRIPRTSKRRIVPDNELPVGHAT